MGIIWNTRWSKKRVVVAGMFTLAAVTLLSISVLAQLDGEYQRSFHIGQQYVGAKSENVVVRVGDQPVYTHDFTVRKLSVESNRTSMKEQISQGNPFASGIQARLDLIEKAGDETVALASLIQDFALVQYALDKGLSVSEAELSAHISATRQAVEEGKVSQSVLGFLDGAGKDSYWTGEYPVIARRGLLIQKLQDTYEGIDLSLKEWKAKRHSIEKDIVNSTTVTVLNQQAIGLASVSGALEYLEAYRALDIFQAS